MKIAYLDCTSGISGDMTLAALVDAGVPFAKLKALLINISAPYKISLALQRVSRCGLGGVKIDIKGADQSCSVHEIYRLIKKGKLAGNVQAGALKILDLLVATEAKVHHHHNVQTVQLHELGSIDTLIDIVGSVWGLDYLGIQKLYVSRLPLTEGTVKTQHGLYPLPAPATMEMLKGCELFKSDIRAELITPTGAAIIAVLAKPSAQLPVFAVSKIGYGAGTWDLPGQPNILRILVGETAGAAADAEFDNVCVLESNIDNVAPEIVGYVIDKLLQAGALDAATLPMYMKKNRPGMMLQVICPLNLVSQIERTIFQEIPTLGIRQRIDQRIKLKRDITTVKTSYGNIRLKLSYLGQKLINVTPEYEDCRRTAEAHNVPLRKVMAAAQNRQH